MTDIKQELIKEAGIFSGIGRGIGKAVSWIGAKPVRTLATGGVLGLGAGLGGYMAAKKIFSSLGDVARALVDFTIRRNPVKYARLTPAQKQSAIDSLVMEFQSNSSLGESARRAAARLSESGQV